MTPEQIEQMKADREAGTDGNWTRKNHPKGSVSEFGVYNVKGRSICSTGIYQDGTEKAHLENLANARRIARVPDLEAEVLRLREALGQAGDAFYSIANAIDDEDYLGQPEGLNTNIYGHFEEYHKILVEQCCQNGERAFAALKGDSYE